MTKPAPVISVVIPAYNAEKYLVQSMESILAQTFTNFEILIIDDGSTDKTLEIANGFTDPRIRVIKNPGNLGLATSCNIGIKNAKGEFIARQDADDWSHPARFTKQLAFMCANPQVGVLGTNTQTINHKGKIGSYKFMPEQVTLDKLLHLNIVIGASAMMRCSVLEQVNGYDEWFTICEDYDLWLRIANDISLIRNLLESLYVYRKHDQSMTNKNPIPTELYRLAAVNNIKGNLTDEIRTEVTNQGIETYQKHLSATDQLQLAQFLASAYKKTNRYAKALNEYQKIAKAKSMSWKIIRNIWLMKWRLQ